MSLGEFDIIQKYFAPLSKGEAGAFNLEDDAALLTPKKGYDLVITKDAIVEGVHFFADDPAQSVAQKLMRVNLSDLAAKGARPIHYLLSCAWPSKIEEDWIQEFCHGLALDQGEFGMTLLGGDTVSTPGPKTFSLTAIGECPSGEIIQRRGAKAGDLVFVSGEIGTSAVGLAAVKGEVKSSSFDLSRTIARYRCPEPRVEFGQALRGLASAALDVSDGLLADCGHIAEVSQVSFNLEAGLVPLGPEAKELVENGDMTLAMVLTGGDDYEICFTIDPSFVDALKEKARDCKTAVSQIGFIENGSGVSIMDARGKKIDIKSAGYRHF